MAKGIGNEAFRFIRAVGGVGYYCVQGRQVFGPFMCKQSARAMADSSRGETLIVTVRLREAWCRDGRLTRS